MAIIYAKKTNNYKAARKFSVAEAKVQRWKEQKQKLINANSTKNHSVAPSTDISKNYKKKLLSLHA
jgi:hypothetical protein